MVEERREKQPAAGALDVERDEEGAEQLEGEPGKARLENSPANSSGDESRERPGDWERAMATLEADLDLAGSGDVGFKLAGLSRAATAADVEGKSRRFQLRREAFWRQYARWNDERAEPLEDTLRFYGDWSLGAFGATESIWPRNELNTEGLYFRWNGFGIALNPSRGFLEQFHRQGHFIGDLNAVVCTRPDPHLHEAIEQIYTLNAQCNQIEEQKHRINYYLCMSTHKALFHRLEPRYKHERGHLHQLDRYIDGEVGEPLALHNGIELTFSYPERGEMAGVAFELWLPQRDLEAEPKAPVEDKRRSFKLNYLPLELCHGPCPESLKGAALTILSLRPAKASNGALPLEGKAPELDRLAEFLVGARTKVALIAECSSGAGDLRLEIAKHLKGQVGEIGQGAGTCVLPADGALQIEMATWRVLCAVTRQWIPAPYVHVIRRQETFGPLGYVSSDCVF